MFEYCVANKCSYNYMETGTKVCLFHWTLQTQCFSQLFVEPARLKAWPVAVKSEILHLNAENPNCDYVVTSAPDNLLSS